MTTGTRPPIYLEQDPPKTPLVLNDSYLLLRLHTARAYIDASLFSQPEYLVCSTEVASNDLPGQAIRGIHQTQDVPKGKPCYLGVRANLTDWLPAKPETTITVKVDFVWTQGKPFGKLSDRIGSLGLAPKLSLVSAELGAGAEVARVAGGILSVLTEEGSSHSLLSLHADFNAADLHAGSYAAVALHGNADNPRALRLSASGQLDDPNVSFSEKNSYAVLEVCVIERRGAEAARAMPWWNALQDGVEQVTTALVTSTEERRELHRAWVETLRKAQRLARQDRSFLLTEIQEIFQAATRKVMQTLQAPPVVLEATSDDDLSDELQDLLGVARVTDLDQSVKRYQAALTRSRGEGPEAGKMDIPFQT